MSKASKRPKAKTQRKPRKARGSTASAGKARAARAASTRRTAPSARSKKASTRRASATASRAAARPRRTTPSRPAAAPRTAPGDDTVVELRDIDCQVHIGVDEAERSTPQRLIVDLALEGNMAGSDGAACGALVEEIKLLLGDGRFVLLEATILRIARLAFRRSPARRVSVRLRKFVLPETDYVAVEMSLKRSEVRRPAALSAGSLTSASAPAPAGGAPAPRLSRPPPQTRRSN